MKKSEIEAALAETFEDFVLSADEKIQLRDAFQPFKYDSGTLQYARNRAFALVRQQLYQSVENHIQSLNWLEGIVKTIDSVRHEHNLKKSRSYFSPGSGCVDKIVDSLGSATSSIDVCVFTISDDVISNAIIDAHNRGVKVRVITDDEKMNDKGSDIAEFVANNIPVKTDNGPEHMHHKFAIFDQRTLLNGSFNWTRSASRGNHENIVIDATPHLVRSFLEIFDSLWDEFIWATGSITPGSPGA